MTDKQHYSKTSNLFKEARKANALQIRLACSTSGYPASLSTLPGGGSDGEHENTFFGGASNLTLYLVHQYP